MKVIGEWNCRRSTGNILRDEEGNLFLQETGDMGGEEPNPEIETWPEDWPKQTGPVEQGSVKFYKE